MKPLMFLLALMFSVTCGACSPSDKDGREGTTQQPGGNGGNNGSDPGTNENMKMKITIGSAEFTATLADNAAATEFRDMLPLTLDMRDYNSNEKVTSLGKNLPVSASNPGTIYAGDLMLWGSNSIVLFYKTFPTSYSYTRLGAIDDASGLEEAVGSGSVTVKFEISEE